MSDLSLYYPPPGTHHYPVDSVVGVVSEDQTSPLIEELKLNGATDDEIGMLTPDRRDDFDIPAEGGGVRGTLKRLVADSGGTLDLMNALRDDMLPGRLIVSVRIGRDDGLRDRAAETFWRFGASQVNYLARFTIERMQKKSPS